MSKVLTALTAALGDAVATDDATLTAHGRDYWARSELLDWLGEPQPLPLAVVTPKSSADMAEAVRICRAHDTAMVTRGGGSGVCGGVLADRDQVVLSTRGLAGLVNFDDHNMLATFGAGTLGSDAENAVAAKGFTIGNWPQSIALSTVGGWVATRASGQFSTAYGNTEDLLYDLEAVLPDGSLFRSRATPRAAAGPDLRQLLLGSEGTLGVVTEVTFSLRPVAESGIRQAFHFADFARGIEAMREVLRRGWRPPVVRLYDARESRRHFRHTCPAGRAMLIFLHEGPEAHTQVEASAVAELCAVRGGEPADKQTVDDWFAHRNTVPSWRELFEQGLVVDTIEVATDWKRLNSLYEATLARFEAVPGLVAASAHSSHAYRSGANLYFTFALAPERDAMVAAYDACWRGAMEAAAECGAGIAHHHGIGRVRRDWLATEIGDAGVELLRSVKRALDPGDLMNPGVLIPR
ncbi:MAG: FAD-binding oxidoreductase [Gammaproteobacteria bacterium]|nr:FAD-binding oxidoreductase [Gammaproteobacteria bacterium]